MSEPSSESGDGSPDDVSEDAPDESTPERGPDEVFCRNCGAVISDQAEICPECGVRQRDPPKSSVDSAIEDLFEGGNPFVAAVLSAVFPGLGQLYNRELEKGLAVIVAAFVAALSALVLIGFILYPAVWLYAVWDAYVVADRQRDAAGQAESGTED
nr:zinc ribbon domain-containing protein [Halorarius litoreus]